MVESSSGSNNSSDAKQESASAFKAVNLFSLAVDEEFKTN